MVLTEHAKQEFLKLGYKPIEECEEDPNKWIQENVLELLKVFSNQGHSGYSASAVINIFSKLAKRKTLSPITCEDDEWENIAIESNLNIYQNNRLSAVFKEGEYGKPYYLDAIIWREDNGFTFTGSAFNSKMEKITSRQYIKIPFLEKKFYVDIVDVELSPGNVQHFIKDEQQLKEVWSYYERQETPSYIRYKKLKELL